LTAKENDPSDCYSKSEGVPYPEDGSECGDEQSSPPLIIIPDMSVSQCCALEEVEMLAPSQTFNIVMAVHFVFILTATALSLYEYFYPHS
jgi:hypothetical protein